jgi:hypothetical protein
MNAIWVKRVPLLAALVLGSSYGSAMAQSMVDCSEAMHFEIANPAPGSHVDAGRYVVQGVAMDARAEDDSPGIDTIDFFLGSRDAGGFVVGHAAPSNVDGLVPNSFQATITLPRIVGTQELFGYAHSSVTGEVSVLSVPIALGVNTNKATDLNTRTPVAECRAGSIAADQAPDAGLAETAPAEEAPSETGGELAAPASATMYLDVGNPSPGDSVHAGALTVQGIAFDSAADGGPGIDHIDIFLDDRNAGGTLVGHGQLGAASAQPDDPNLAGAGWSARILLPIKLIGPHSLFFYAMSGVTGEEMAVAIPVRIVP